MPLCLRTMLLCLMALIPIACSVVEPHTARRSLLPDAKPGSDSVALEVFFAHFPRQDKQISDLLWREIDEQQFSAEVRRALTQNGIRAGLVGTHLPDELAKILKISDKPQSPEQHAAVDLEAEPTVTSRWLSMRHAHRGEILLTDVREELPLLMREAGEPRGRTYLKAQGMLAVKTFPQSDGRVRLEITPELHHGEQKQRWAGGDGILRLEIGRAKEVFDALRLKADLAPGEMLVMTSLADRSGSVGHAFFTEPGSEAMTQKLLVIRLAQTNPERLFSESPVKTLDAEVILPSP